MTTEALEIKQENDESNAGNQEQKPRSILQPFEETFSGYLKEIDNLYKEGLKEYQEIVNEYAKKIEETSNDLNKDMVKANEELSNSLVEAWRKSEPYITYAQIQDQSLKDVFVRHEVKNKDIQKLQEEVLERINELNKRYKGLFNDAFATYKSDHLRNLSDLKQEEIDAHVLYTLGYINMASAWYGYVTTSN